MKTPQQLISIALVILTLATVYKAQNLENGINFNQLTWQQAKQKAQAENKFRFIDCNNSGTGLATNVRLLNTFVLFLMAVSITERMIAESMAKTALMFSV